VEVNWLIFKTHILYVALWVNFTDDLCLVLVLFKIIMLSTFLKLFQSSTYQSLYTSKFFYDVTYSLQTYILMCWIRIDFCGTRLRSWSFLCVSFSHSQFLSMHYEFLHWKFHNLRWASTLNPTHRFVITSSTTTQIVSMDDFGMSLPSTLAHILYSD
jgi:hypothetical protein